MCISLPTHFGHNICLQPCLLSLLNCSANFKWNYFACPPSNLESRISRILVSTDKSDSKFCDKFIFRFCRSNRSIMADRDIPSVPITTLAGLTSLSDRKYLQLYFQTLDVCSTCNNHKQTKHSIQSGSLKCFVWHKECRRVTNLIRLIRWCSEYVALEVLECLWFLIRQLVLLTTNSLPNDELYL